MARARTTAKRRRIVIVKPQEDKGDLQISASEAKLRLTPKLFMTLALLIVGVLSIVIVVQRYLARQGSLPAPMSAALSGQPEGTQAASVNNPPQMMNAVIIPANPDASTPLDVKYEAVDQDGNFVSYTFRWFVNNSQVQEGSSSALQPGAYRSGDVVVAEVVPADAFSQGSPFRTDPITIGASAPRVGGVTLSPETPLTGDILTAKPTEADGAAATISIRYQWYVNGDAVGDPGSENTFDTRNLKKRDSVSVAVTATDGKLSGGPVRSNMVFIHNRKPEIISSAPEGLQGSSYAYQVVARDPDGDALKYRLERAPAGMTINESSGLIQWSLRKDTMYPGRNEAAVRVTVDDSDGGTVSQDFRIIFTDLYVQ